MTAETPATDPSIDALPFEVALEHLEEIVRKLERGEALKRHCESMLKQAEARIQRIALTADGRPEGVAPLDVS